MTTHLRRRQHARHGTLKRLCAVASFAVSLGLASPALASPDLATAENAYAALDYPTALAAAENVLAQRGLGHDVLTRATRVAALSHAALGHADQAKQLFSTLLEYDSEFKVDTKLGPRFTEPFAEARGYWQAQGKKPGMEVQAIIQWHQVGQIRATTADPLGIVKRLVVGFRWAPAREYTSVNVEPGTRQVDVPASGGSTRLDYYVRALDAKDNAVFEEGSPEAPKTVVVNEPARSAQEERTSFFGSPLFYIIGGVVIAGAAAGGYFALRPTEYTASPNGRTLLGAGCGAAKCE
jgi:hypothetical protein